MQPIVSIFVFILIITTVMFRLRYLYRILLPIIFVSFANCKNQNPEVIPLYTNTIPNSINKPDKERNSVDEHNIPLIHHVSKPTLSIFLPPKEKANGSAVIICPGGGYAVLAADHEGTKVAERFNEMGIAAFVLKYRIPDGEYVVKKEIGPLQDAQRAIQIVRENAERWSIDKNKIGIMGFSAGGHLASTTGTHFQKAYIPNPNKTSLRPDYMILVYPVISFSDSIGHLGSRKNLLGKNPSKEKIIEFSNELQVNAQTPPAFLVHAKDDAGVKVNNSLVFAEALRKNNVPVDMFIYEKGGHGFGMKNKTSREDWMIKVQNWMKEMKFIK